jgi:hypothetical protein
MAAVMRMKKVMVMEDKKLDANNNEFLILIKLLYKIFVKKLKVNQIKVVNHFFLIFS